MPENQTPAQALEVAPAESAPVSLDPQAQTPAAPVEITAEIVRNQPVEIRDALLFGEAPAAEDETPKPETPEPKPAAAEPERLLPNRISTAQFDEREQEAIALKHELKGKGENITLSEACSRVDAKYAGPKAAADAPAADAIPGADDTGPTDPIAAMKAEAESIRDQIKAHADELMPDDLADLVDQLASKRADIKMAEYEAKQTQKTEHTQRLGARESSKSEVLAEFPTAGDDDSLLGAEIALQYLRLQSDPQHPDKGRFAQDDGPKWLTQKAVEAVKARLVHAHGYTPEQALNVIKGKPAAEAKGPATPFAKPVSTAVPKHLAVVAPGNRPAAEPSVTDAKTLLKQADRKTIDAVLFGGGGTVIHAS